jgi:DNA modification methylase
MNPTSEADIKRKEDYGNSYAGRASNLPDLGKFGQYGKGVQEWHKGWVGACHRVLSEDGSLMAFNSSKTSHRMIAAMVELGFHISIDAWVYLSGMPKARDLGAGVGWYTNLKPSYEPIIVCRKQKGETMHKSHLIYIGRKPLSERNIAENVLKHGTGAMNIDACRIGDEERTYTGSGESQMRYNDDRAGLADGRGKELEFTVKGRWPANSIFSSSCAKILTKQIGAEASTYFFISEDRFDNHNSYNNNKENTMNVPSDLLDYLHTMITPTHVGGESLIIQEGLNDHDFSQYTDNQWHGCIAVGTPTEETSKELMRVMKAGAHLMLIAPEEEPTGYKGACQIEDTGFEIRDSIFWARETDPENPNFMYMPKASRSERELGTEHLKKVSGAEAVDRKEGSAGMDNPRAGAGRTATEIGNFHPTVKPIGIMEWLARDVPKGATVLDPFMGSGTMGIACVKTGHSYIGTEIDESYFPIADARIRHWNETYCAWDSAEVISDLDEEETEDVLAPIDLNSFLGF